MENEENLFNSIGQSIDNSTAGQLFGKPCFKINSKAFVCFFQKSMVFKLTGDAHSEAISLDGAILFDPSGKNRPMKEWVQLPYTYHSQWKHFATQAVQYVSQN